MIVHGDTIRARQSLRPAADALEKPDRARRADMATPPIIEANDLSHPADVTATAARADLCRARGSARAFRPSGAARAD